MDVKMMLVATAFCAAFALAVVLASSPNGLSDAHLRFRGRVILGSFAVGSICLILAAGWPS